MEISGPKNLPTLSKLHHWYYSSLMLKFPNTSKIIIQTFNFNSILEFLYSKEILTMVRNKISNSKIFIWLFCCLSMKKRKFSSVISRRKFNQWVLISKKEQLSLQKQFLSFYIPAYWFLLLNRFNQEHRTFASFLKLISFR